jgi:hypothetical protein
MPDSSESEVTKLSRPIALQFLIMFTFVIIVMTDFLHIDLGTGKFPAIPRSTSRLHEL